MRTSINTHTTASLYMNEYEERIVRGFRRNLNAFICELKTEKAPHFVNIGTGEVITEEMLRDAMAVIDALTSDPCGWVVDK